MKRAYVPLGCDQQGHVSPTLLQRAMDTNVEPWHLPHFALAVDCGVAPAGECSRLYQRDGGQRIDTDAMLAAGTIEGPFKPCHPVTRWSRALRRFARALGRFLAARRIEL